MARKIFLKMTAFVSVFLCFVTVQNTSAFAVKSQPDSTVESISVYKQSGVLKGETIQLKAEVEASSSLFDAVEWSSSNPQAISCTKDGKIKGLIAGEYATITCKAKYGSQKVSIRVYCAEMLPKEVKVRPKYIVNFISPYPGLGIKDLWLNTSSIFNPILEMFKAMARISTNVYIGSKITACGRIDDYVYIRYGDSNSLDGFMQHSRFKETIDGFLELSAKDMNVWANGVANEEKKLTVNYDGDVKWTFDKNYVKFDEKTGQVIGLKPGVTTIIAKADGMAEKCTIHLLYKWPQEWVTETNKATYLYKAIGSEYDARKALSKGTEVTVWGDTGTDDGWAYGSYTDGEKTWWGHIPIADVSTKGTISQYRLLNWAWPVSTLSGKNKANFISSPYGKRSASPTMHKGVDITTGVPGEIKEYEVVSAFNGKVIHSDYSSSTGYCVGVRSDITDPISGEKMIAFYMHLNEQPDVKYGQNVEIGQRLGSVGNTGNSGGYHLHFEVNNKNASIGDGSTARNYYAYLINPLFFFIDYTNNYVIGKEEDKRKDGNENKIIIDETCSTVVSFFGAYWYGDDREEK